MLEEESANQKMSVLNKSEWCLYDSHSTTQPQKSKLWVEMDLSKTSTLVKNESLQRHIMLDETLN